MTMKHLLTAAAMTFALTMAANAAQPTATDQQSTSAPSMTAQASPTKGHVDGEGGSDALAKFGRQQVDGEGGSAALNRFTRTGKAEE
jgi:hypothetical protein